MLTRRTLEDMVRLVGIPMRLMQTKQPQTVIPLPKAGIRTMKAEDTLVNSYGVGSKVITILQSDVGAVVPAKFDRMEINGGEIVTLEHVAPVYEPLTGVTIAFKAYVKSH